MEAELAGSPSGPNRPSLTVLPCCRHLSPSGRNMRGDPRHHWPEGPDIESETHWHGQAPAMPGRHLAPTCHRLRLGQSRCSFVGAARRSATGVHRQSERWRVELGCRRRAKRRWNRVAGHHCSSAPPSKWPDVRRGRCRRSQGPAEAKVVRPAGPDRGCADPAAAMEGFMSGGGPCPASSWLRCLDVPIRNVVTSIDIVSGRSRLAPEQRTTATSQTAQQCLPARLRSHSAVSPRRPADCCKRSNDQQEKEASHGLLTNVSCRTHSVNYVIAEKAVQVRDRGRYAADAGAFQVARNLLFDASRLGPILLRGLPSGLVLSSSK